MIAVTADPAGTPGSRVMKGGCGVRNGSAADVDIGSIASAARTKVETGIHVEFECLDKT
jgi:hypothetical protein